jgi:hypothetical protein
MHRVHQVTAEKIEILGRASFERYSFDREVQAMASLSAKVLDPANGLSASTRHGLWAFLTAPGYGAMLSKGSRSKYRVLARELGVSLRPGVDEDVVQDVLVRLDFDAGREVCRVAGRCLGVTASVALSSGTQCRPGSSGGLWAADARPCARAADQAPPSGSLGWVSNVAAFVAAGLSFR